GRQNRLPLPVDRARAQPTDVAEVLVRLYGTGGDRGQHDIVGDEVRTDVGALRGALAPGGELTQHGELAPRMALPSLHEPIALVRRDLVEAPRLLERAQLLRDPGSPSAALELRAQTVVEREEMRHLLLC